MEYQITCVCGHSFLVSGKQIEAGPVTCPVCKQRLSPVIEGSKSGGGGGGAGSAGQSPQSPGSQPPPVSADVDAEIVEGATESPAGTRALPAGGAGDEAGEARGAEGGTVRTFADRTKRCPFCGEVILAIARKCKHCGEFLDRSPPPPPPPAHASQGPGDVAQGNVPGTGPGAPGTPPTTADVPPIYALSVSQWDNFWKFTILATLVGLVMAALVFITPLQPYAVVGSMGAFVIAAFFGWFFYLNARNTRCYVRPTRIDTEEGILSKSLNTLELFRITDIELKQGFTERLLGIGSIKLMTADNTNPELVLYQIPKAREVYKYIQNQIPVAARKRGAVFMETN